MAEPGVGERAGMPEPRSYAAIFQPRDGKSFYRRRSHVGRAGPAPWRPPGDMGTAPGMRGEAGGRVGSVLPAAPLP